MGVYCSLLFFAWLFLLAVAVHPKYEASLSKLYMGLLMLIAMFRYNVGVDYKTYEIMFNEIIEPSYVKSSTEIGFVILCKACAMMGGTAQMMFLLMSFATLLIFFCTYKRYSPNIIVTLFVFMCFGQMYLNTFNVVRQCLAVALFCYSMQYIQQRHLLKYLLCIGIAALFHMTALILVPMYWILRVHWNYRVRLLIILGVIFSGNIIMRIIESSPYAIYLKFESFSQSASFVNYLYLLLGMIIFILEKRLMRGYEDRQLFLNLNYCSLLLFILFFIFANTPLTMVVVRLEYYFIFFYAIIFVRIMFDIRKHILRMLTYVIVCLFLSFMFVRTTMFLGYEYELLPFSFNFNLLKVII